MSCVEFQIIDGFHGSVDLRNKVITDGLEEP